MGQKVQPVPTSNHYCRRWRVLDYLRSQRAANILIATFALDAVLYLDIYISLRTAIVTPHGISAECNSSTRRGRATALRNFGTPVLMPIPFDVERPNRHNRYGEGEGRVYIRDHARPSIPGSWPRCSVIFGRLGRSTPRLFWDHHLCQNRLA